MQKRSDGATVTKWGESGSDLVTDEREYMVVEHMRRSTNKRSCLLNWAQVFVCAVEAVRHDSPASRPS
jgi:hypothetical protein